MSRAIIIGASSGIGKVLAHELASNGYNVGITGRRLDLLQAIHKSNPEQFTVRAFDCTQDNSLSELEAMVEELGGLDLFMVSAGTGDLNETLDASIENKTNHLNVAAFTEIVGWAYNYFQSQKKGHLVAISSIAGLRGNKMAPAYGASKAYQINYLEGLQQKAHSEGGHVLITDIRPGFVNTAMAKGPGQFWVASPEKAARQIYRHIRNKRKVAYVTNRWRLFALLMKWMPRGLYRRF